MMRNALIVDDSKAVLMILAKILKGLGYEIREVTDGTEALQVIEVEKLPIELVLVDWNMPEMNGLELLKRIRQDPALSSMVVVMVTTETDLPHMTAALEAGANEYVMKPFTKDILVEKLQIAGLCL